MGTRRAFVVVCLCLLAGLGVSLAVTLEEDYVARTPGWLPIGPFGQVSIQKQHEKWHGIEAQFSSTVRGREFLEFHREVLAQSDDFRIYGSDTETSSDPDPVVIPILARNGDILPAPSWVRFGRDGSPCSRGEPHRIDDGPHGQCNKNSAFWTPRDGNLKLGTATFHLYTAAELGSNILPFHTNGHGAIGRHGPSDMIGPATSTKDPAFYQWHKTIDNIYADWAIAKYRLVATSPLTNLSGMPIFFSVSPDSTGSLASSNSLNERSRGDVYQGSTSSQTPANQYGAKPRIGSDIYVGRNFDPATSTGYSNLVYAPGTKEWNTLLNGWDIDAWSILNSVQNSWYFSVTKGSAGATGTAVDLETDLEKGGDLFESCADNKNKVLRNEFNLGLAAADELDALEFDRERRVQGSNDNNTVQIHDRPRQWFSLRSLTTHGVRATVAATGEVRAVVPSDILRFNDDGQLVIDVRGVEDLGLAAGDDLDALALVDVDRLNTLNAGDLVYYSVAPGSVAGAPADILCKTIGLPGPPAFAACPGVLAAALGLDGDGILPDDDLDALDVRWDTCPLSGGLPAGPLGSPTGPPPTFHGACCGYLGQACAEDKSQSECETAGGTFAGVDSVCATALCASAPGACCATNGNCVEVSDQTCYNSAGTFRGPGTTCPPTGGCPVAPPNDECVNAIVIPYNFVSGFQPPANNTTATRPHYSLPEDPPYSCMDHNVFADARGSGTLWYSYTVPVIAGASELTIKSEERSGPGLEMTPGPGPRRSIFITTNQAAEHYPGGGGAGDTRLALFYAPNNNCSVLQEVACADNIPGDGTSLATYASLRYDRPVPGTYYLMVSTVYNVDRGNTYLTVFDPPDQPAASVPTVSTWGLVILTLVLIGWGYTFLPRRKRPAV